MAVPSGVIGVVHVHAMPGDPLHQEGGFEAVAHAARRDFHALIEGGVRALVFENFGSVPFFKGSQGERLEPHQVAFMASLAKEARLADPKLVVGVNCLRNDAHSAMGIAAAIGLDFIRVNVHTGAYVTDQGIIEGDAARTLRYRKMLGATHVSILADVLVKHAFPLGELDVEVAVHDCLERGLADAVIVSGVATGSPVSLPLLERVRATTTQPVLIGSGLNLGNCQMLAPLAHGAFVGTALKEDGVVRAPVVADRVQGLVATCHHLFAKMP